MSNGPPPITPLDYVSADPDCRRGMIRILAILSIIYGAALAGMQAESLQREFLPFGLSDFGRTLANRHWTWTAVNVGSALLLLAGILMVAGGVRSVTGRPRPLLPIAALLVLLFQLASELVDMAYIAEVMGEFPSWQVLALSAIWPIHISLFPLAIVLLFPRLKAPYGQDRGKEVIRVFVVLSIIWGAALTVDYASNLYYASVALDHFAPTRVSIGFWAVHLLAGLLIMVGGFLYLRQQTLKTLLIGAFASMLLSIAAMVLNLGNWSGVTATDIIGIVAQRIFWLLQDLIFPVALLLLIRLERRCVQGP